MEPSFMKYIVYTDAGKFVVEAKNDIHASQRVVREADPKMYSIGWSNITDVRKVTAKTNLKNVEII